MRTLSLTHDLSHYYHPSKFRKNAQNAEVALPSFPATAEDEAEGRTQKAVAFADGVFQVAFVGEMDQITVVDKKDKGGRVYPGLVT